MARRRTPSLHNSYDPSTSKKALLFITAVAVLLAPVVNRLLPKFHLEFESPESDTGARPREAGGKSGAPE